MALDRPNGIGRSAISVVQAEGDPGSSIRILAPFARHDSAIDRLACTTDHATLRVEACVRDMRTEAMRHVAGGIQQVVGVVRLDLLTELGAGPSDFDEPEAAGLFA